MLFVILLALFAMLLAPWTSTRMPGAQSFFAIAGVLAICLVLFETGRLG